MSSSNKRELEVEEHQTNNERRVSPRLITSSLPSIQSDKEIISNLRSQIRDNEGTIENLNSTIQSMSTNNNNLNAELIKLSKHVSEINSKYATLLDTKNDLDHLISDYPHKLAMEIINCVNHALEHPNKLNFNLLRDYTHEEFIHKEIELQGGSDITTLINNIFVYLKEEKYKNKVISRISLAEQRRMEIRELKAKAIIIASLMSFTNPLFTWDYFTIIGLTVRFITSSKMVIDLISMVSPSGFTGKTLESRLYNYIKYCKSKGNQICSSAHTIICFDNCPLGVGYFYTGSRELGTEMGNPLQPIVAASAACHIFQSEDWINIQKELRFSPRLDKKYLDAEGNILADFPRDLHVPLTENQDANEGCESEVVSFLTERNEYFLSRMNAGVGRVLFLNSLTDLVTVPIAIEDGVMTHIGFNNPSSNNFYQCNLCDTKFFTVGVKQVCNGIGCGLSSDKRFEMRHFINNELVAGPQPVPTLFTSTNLPQRLPLSSIKECHDFEMDCGETPDVDSLYRSLSELPSNNNDPMSTPAVPILTTTTIPLSTQEDLSNSLLTPLLPQSTPDLEVPQPLTAPTVETSFGNSSINRSNFITKKSSDVIIMEKLYSFQFNPNSKVNIDEIYRLIGEMMFVRGFVPSHLVQRESIDVSADIGATNFQTLDNPPPDKAHYRNIRFVHPGGHEYFCINHVVMKLAWELGLDICAKPYGFVSFKQVNFFMLGTLSHKTYEFLLIIREVLTDYMLAEYYRSLNLSRDDNFFQFSVNEFILWMTDEEAQSDIHFSNIVFFIMNTLPAYFAMMKGIRNNMYSVYNGGRKLLLPFLGILGKHVYFKACWRDIITIKHLCSEDYRLFRKRFFTFGVQAGQCQSLDLKMEEEVAGMQQTGINASAEGSDIAALVSAISPDIRHVAYEQGGKNDPKKYNQPRPEIEYRITKQKIFELFKQKSISFAKVPNRVNACTIDMKFKFIHNTHFTELQQIGLETIRDYCETGCKKTPVKIVLRTDQGQQEAEQLILNINNHPEVERIIEEAATRMEELESQPGVV